jgi:hypothetical protein
LPRISSTWKQTAPVAEADPIRDLHLLERVPVEPLLVVTPAEGMNSPESSRLRAFS